MTVEKCGFVVIKVGGNYRHVIIRILLIIPEKINAVLFRKKLVPYFTLKICLL